MLYIPDCLDVTIEDHNLMSPLSLCLVLEYCGARHRTVPLVALMVSYSAASVLTPLAASLLPHWIYLTVPVSALTLPVLVLSRCLH